ncbi:MAG: hypothetical protein JW726_16230, partial [Anaerolineales bacterium]|nr:hypothetical protein [Anaerolineales bacterium]
MRRSLTTALRHNPILLIPFMVILCSLLPLAEEIIYGLANPWQALPPPPSAPVELLGTGSALGHNVHLIEEDGQVQGDVYILAEDGLVYHFEEYDDVWRQGQASHVAARVLCNTTGSWLSRKQGECVQGNEEVPSPTVVHRFLLDQHGVLWHWKQIPSLCPSSPFCGLSGLLIGLLLAIALAAGNRQKSRPPPPPPPPPP